MNINQSSFVLIKDPLSNPRKPLNQVSIQHEPNHDKKKHNMKIVLHQQ